MLESSFLPGVLDKVVEQEEGVHVKEEVEDKEENIVSGVGGKKGQEQLQEVNKLDDEHNKRYFAGVDQEYLLRVQI